MSETNKLEPVYFTFYFDKDFYPDEAYMSRKEEYCRNVLKQKVVESGASPKDYDEEPVVLSYNGNPLITSTVTVGNFWKDVCNIMRVALFPKGYDGERELREKDASLN